MTANQKALEFAAKVFLVGMWIISAALVVTM